VAKLIYSSITSLDGYVADDSGDFTWGRPDLEVHTFINDLQRPIRTFLFGRRMYEVMSAWETMTSDSPEMTDFAAQWHAAEKVVYSRTLDHVSTAHTSIRHDFDSAEVSDLLRLSDHDLLIGGPAIAAEALRAGLVDEIHQFVYPVIVGGGTAFLPNGLRTALSLVDERRFGASGVVYLRYDITR